MKAHSTSGSTGNFGFAAAAIISLSLAALFAWSEAVLEPRLREERAVSAAQAPSSGNERAPVLDGGAVDPNPASERELRISRAIRSSMRVAKFGFLTVSLLVGVGYVQSFRKG